MKTTHISSYDEYFEYIEQYKNKYYFRGQANNAWNLLPSLFRSENRSDLITECIGIRREQKNFKEANSTLSALLKMQHYGNKTRILDLTISPLTALFFAVDDDYSKDKDGVVYVFNKEVSVNSNCDELNLFAQVFNLDNPDLSNIFSDTLSAEEIKSVLSKNYVVKYDYNFVYSNSRALLQGGTGVIFGFDCHDNLIKSIGNMDISDILYEQIIIPATIKSAAMEELRKIGYSKKILHHEFENVGDCEDFELIEEEFNVEKRVDTDKKEYKAFAQIFPKLRPDLAKNPFLSYELTKMIIDNPEKAGYLGEQVIFNKVVAKYRVTSLYCSKEDLIKKIKALYNQLTSKYGETVRMWLYVYYDQTDINHFLWICRTQWSNDCTFEIIWEKSYFMHRLKIINEQASRAEIVEKYSSLIMKITPFYKEIFDEVSNSNFNVKKFMHLIKEAHHKIDKIGTKANNIPYGDDDVEQFASKAKKFINNVSWFVNDIGIYSNNPSNLDLTLQITLLQNAIFNRNVDFLEYLKEFNKRSESNQTGFDIEKEKLMLLIKWNYLKHCEESRKDFLQVSNGLYDFDSLKLVCS